MDAILTTALFAHIITGYTALTAGTSIMILKKGDRRHQLIGRVFYLTMLAVSASALVLAGLKSNMFLVHIAIFVLYQNVAGRRSVKKKSLLPNVWDILLLVAALVNGILMLFAGNPVLMVFGGISVFLVFNDLRIYYRLHRKKQMPKLGWKARHIGMMMGAYIGALTAFLVVNVSLSGWPGIVLWLAPTAVFVPLMQWWTWKFTMEPGRRL